MEQNITFRLIAEKEGKEVARTTLGYEALCDIARSSVRYHSKPLYAEMDPLLVQYPHAEVWRTIADRTEDPEVFTALLLKKDCETIKNLCANDAFLKTVDQEVILSLIDRDLEYARIIGGNRSTLEENETIDMNTIHARMESLENYEIDRCLADDGHFKGVVKKFKNHPDPQVAATAIESLD